YPSHVMETGYEILFFWVARMVFFGIEVMGELPFHTVYLHGTVRDTEGLKMSKTKGNVLDPTEITATYGADALRFALVTQGSPGLDMRLSMTLVESSRNFINKLWNATRFALRAIDEAGVVLDADGPARPDGDLPLPDRWILSRLDVVNAGIDRLFSAYLFGEAGRQLREFIWSEFCDWYIEAAKVRLRGTDLERRQVAQTLAYVLDRSLRLLHPFMPFATESMWLALPHQGPSVMIARWPVGGVPDAEAEESWTRLSDLIVRIRNARTESGVEAGKWLPARIHAGESVAAYHSVSREISALARLDPDALTISSDAPEPADGDLVVVGEDIVAILPMAGIVDIEEERERLKRDLDAAQLERSRAEGQLSNSNFVDRAPAQVVQVQRDRLASAEEKIGVLTARLAELAAR
ncbi:MAG: class I tRNA ligase family protein, partial [Thermomicrobiales bacterium]